MLGRLAEVFPQVPRLAVTATADARTRGDIRAELRLADALQFVDTFARPELALLVDPRHASRRRSPRTASVEACVIGQRRDSCGDQLLAEQPFGHQFEHALVS